MHNYSGLLAVRFFLGLTEGAILPVRPYHTILSSQADILGLYYIPLDLLLQSGIGETGRHILLCNLPRRRLLGSSRGCDIEHGRQRWKGGMGLDFHSVRDRYFQFLVWLMISEGIVTVIIGSATFFILPRDPATAKFLSDGERESILLALERDREFQE